MQDFLKSFLVNFIFAVFFAGVFSLGAYAEATAAEKNIILATTTSTQDSGLLDVLIPLFEKQTGYMVKTIAVGKLAFLYADHKEDELENILPGQQPD